MLGSMDRAEKIKNAQILVKKNWKNVITCNSKVGIVNLFYLGLCFA